jgi:NodT family efflux transporter outer membrane factor (OMF) lipoprotein
MTDRRAAAPLGIALAALLGACSSFAPPVEMPPHSAPAMDPPTGWFAPLPQQGQRQDELRQWWQQFDDPVLVALIDSAQAASPTVAGAASRIEQARAARTAASAALLPALNANASASSGRSDLVTPVAGFAGASLRASWELDLFGANSAARDAAQARLVGAQAGWHDARISVAAEVATTYNALRGCEALVQQTEADVRSREETARVTELAANAGLVAPANAALARASAAQGRNLLRGQRAQCELLVKAIVALAAVDEEALQQQLAPRRAQLPLPAAIQVERVPAAALMQRPDLLSAEARVVASAQDTTQSQAQRYPRVGIAGSVGPALLRIESSSVSGNLWTLGPLQVSLPLFDGGALRANVVAARARYDEAVSGYRALVRVAVREVESALVTLDSTTRRTADAQIAADNYQASLRAADARFRGGLGSLFDLEEARRSALVANSTLVELQRDRVAAWISLYRALGGGWSAADAEFSGGWTAADAEFSGDRPAAAPLAAASPAP